ncbi:toxin-antitoxin system HicB family antitoxin [Streptomyces sp. NPDC092296]|uniref:toxin-antitoxin system HicB family antitoxin n=1 Tax=Streptomyces sp. NPDC092296 TaxID=3366012 RepID=UPI00382FC488
MAERKKFLLRIDPKVHDALQRWADDELRSLNAHIEFLLRRSLDQAGRAVRDAPPPRRGRPPRDRAAEADPAAAVPDLPTEE